MDINFDLSWQKIKGSDVKTFETLYKKFYAPLCYYSRQITRDNYLSEEIVQDIFHKIWQEREIISIQNSFKSYLFQSVRNSSINEIKKRSSRKFSVNKTTTDEMWNYVMENVESNDFIIEQLISTDTSKTIEKAVNGLPPHCHHVFQLSRTENKSNEEIAMQLGISVNTVRAHIFTALSKISESLRKEK
jgi:RNA polymerase sigma-70 factor, ECF subfamily